MAIQPNRAQNEAISYIHPSSGAEVVDVVCPKHPKVKGHVAKYALGTATCGLILKSHKESSPTFEEIIDGKKVKRGGAVTVVDDACKEILVAAAKPKAVKGQKTAKEIGDEEAADREPANAHPIKAAKHAGKSAKAEGKRGKAAKKVERHPDAV